MPDTARKVVTSVYQTPKGHTTFIGFRRRLFEHLHLLFCSGARSVPTITPAPILIPAVEPTPEATKAVEHPLLGVLTGKKIIDTPTPTPQATKAVTHPVLGVLLGKEVTSASTPVPTILVPATPAATIPILIPSTPIATIPAVTLPAAITPAVIVSGNVSNLHDPNLLVTSAPSSRSLHIVLLTDFVQTWPVMGFAFKVVHELYCFGGLL